MTSKGFANITVADKEKKDFDEQRKLMNMSGTKYLRYLMDHCEALEIQILNRFRDMKNDVLIANKDDPEKGHLIDLYFDAYQKTAKSGANLEELNALLVEYISGRRKYTTLKSEGDNNG